MQAKEVHLNAASLKMLPQPGICVIWTYIAFYLEKTLPVKVRSAALVRSAGEPVFRMAIDPVLVYFMIETQEKK